MIIPHIQSRLQTQSHKYTSPVLHVYGFILQIPITIMVDITSQMSPEYILYSLERSTDPVLSIWSLVNAILVV